MEADPFENIGGDSSDEEGAQSDPNDDGDSSGDDNPFEDPDNEDGEDENQSDSDEDSPQNDLGLRFWMACSAGDIEAAKIALAEGANPLWKNFDCNGISGDNMLPLYGLFIAAQNGHAEVVRWLISLRTEDHFASPADTFGEENESTALHFAAMNDHIEIMKMLLEDENAPDVNQGTEGTALHFAALRGRIAAARFLLDNGADIAAVDEEGQLPIFGAAYQGKTDMCRFLYERGAKVNVVDETADTPLFNAAFAGSLSTIKFFVEEADANLEYRKSDGRSAFDHANEHSMSESALYLWKHGCGAPVRRPSKFVAKLQRLYAVNAPLTPLHSAGVFGSRFCAVAAWKKAMYWCDLEKVFQVNLMAHHNASLVEPALLAKRAWDPSRVGNLLKLNDEYEVAYVGTAQDWAGSVQSNFVIVEDFFYYEITVLSTGDTAEIAIGVAWDRLDVHEELPGWSPISWALHGDNGDFYIHDNPGLSYSLRFSAGDTVGMGINKITGEIFVTMNGEFLGVGCVASPQHLLVPLHATVGLRTPGSVVVANFGQQPFKFDFIVDAIKWHAQKIGEIPSHRGVAVGEEIIWPHLKGGLVRLDVKTGKTTMQIVKDFHPRPESILPSAHIDGSLWVFESPCQEFSANTFYPFLEIWQIKIDGDQLSAVLHKLPTVEFRRPLPKMLPIDFAPHAKGNRLYFFFPPAQASFYLDTATLTVHEMNATNNAPGYVLWQEVSGTTICFTTYYEYPWKSVVFSALEGDEWTAMRLTGSPMRTRANAAFGSWKNMFVMVGGRNEDIPCVDFDVVTFTNGFESQNGVGFLQTPEGEQYCDWKLAFPDGESMKVHKAVLFARSQKFREMLASSSGDTVSVPVKYQAFKHVVDYLYTDTVSLSIAPDFTRQLADVFEEWIPEHALRACEYMTLNRVMTPSSIGPDFARLLQDDQFCDISLIVDGKTLRAHRAILVARSAYFRAMLLGKLRESSQSEIEIDGTSFEAFKIILDHIYSLSAEPSDFPELIVDVIIAAAKFGVDPLVRMLEAVIAHNIDADNASSLAEMAETHGFAWLKLSCQKFMAK